MATPVEVVFVDCDDCLYQNNWSTAQKITDCIAAYTKQLGVSKEKAYELYQTYGTCIKGLLVEGVVDDAGVEDFLIKAHQISYEDILPDPALRSVIARVVPKRFVFTAAPREHCERCLDKIGIKDLFLGIVDTRVCKLETKHSDAAFQAAMAFAGTGKAASCVLIDDSIKNIQAAKRQGWQTVLVGMTSRDTGKPVSCPEADYHIPYVHDLPKVMPVLFQSPSKSGTVDRRLYELGIELPPAMAPVANYVAFAPTGGSGDTIYISGQISKNAAGTVTKGQLGAAGQGEKLKVEEGKAAARICALNILAQLRAACDGDLDRVARILRIEGFVCSTPEFTEHPAVINGASDLMVEVFGKAVGSHSRFAVGCSSLPLGVAVEVGAIVEIKPSKSSGAWKAVTAVAGIFLAGVVVKFLKKA